MGELPVCGQLALPKFRKQAEGLMTPCCCEPDHTGNHVYCIKVQQGVTYNSHSLHFFEEVKRTELKPVMNVSMAGRKLSSTEECSAVWQYMEASRHG